MGSLRLQLVERDTQIAQLSAQVETLQTRIAELLDQSGAERQRTAQPTQQTAQPTHRCVPDLWSAEFVDLIRDGWRAGRLPLGGKPGAFAGMNARLGRTVRKRDWRRGGQSNSISRHLQHRFMWHFVDTYGPRLPPRARCLDWDGWYGGSVFASVCAEVDVIEYARPFGRVATKPLHWARDRGRRATRWFHADAHSMSEHLPAGAYDLVIANSVFEHLSQPFVAMREVTKLLRRGGLLFWHSPFEFEQHGVPFDYFRFTVAGARELASSAGLAVELAEGDGGLGAVLSNVLGLGAKFWADADLRRGENASSAPVGHYMSTRMVARKP